MISRASSGACGPWSPGRACRRRFKSAMSTSPAKPRQGGCGVPAPRRCEPRKPRSSPEALGGSERMGDSKKGTRAMARRSSCSSAGRLSLAGESSMPGGPRPASCRSCDIFDTAERDARQALAASGDSRRPRRARADLQRAGGCPPPRACPRDPRRHRRSSTRCARRALADARHDDRPGLRPGSRTGLAGEGGRLHRYLRRSAVKAWVAACSARIIVRSARGARRASAKPTVSPSRT